MGYWSRLFTTTLFYLSEKAKLDEEQRILEERLRKMYKYQDVPADEMTTDQIIEDIRNSGLKVIIKEEGYIIVKKSKVVGRLRSENQLRQWYVSYTRNFKTCF